jgi:hypothetical protein
MKAVEIKDMKDDMSSLFHIALYQMAIVNDKIGFVLSH